MKRLLLALIILIVATALMGCCYTCCGGYVAPSTQCYLTITATADSWTWGTIYVNGKSTNQYIHYQWQPTAIVSVPCNAWATIDIVDPCGDWSHEEGIYISSGMNYLYFTYWKNKDKSNDFHQS
jgi:hypothetical protein